MTSKKNSNYFRGDLWFQEQVKSRARAELSRQQESFAEEHKDDTEEQLIAYVRGFANALGRTPNAGEVIGGPYIASRFGSWNRLVSKAGLPRPGMMPQMERRLIYKKEVTRQEILLRRELQSKKELVKSLRAQKQEERKEMLREQEARDQAWGTLHEQDTEQQLLDYVRRCAEELGHTPVSREVEGSTWIAHRIGSWSLVLTLARLPLPKGMEPPKPKTWKAYRERKQAEKQVKDSEITV